MNIVRSMLVCAVLLLASISSAPADVLRGHLSGFEAENARVDLRIRFFESEENDGLVAERKFVDVPVLHGEFSVSLSHAAVPFSAHYVEVALRPSSRPYSFFRTIPPRQRLNRRGDGVLIALERPRSDTPQLSGSTFVRKTALLTQRGEL